MKLRKEADLGWADATNKMMRPALAWMLEPRRGDHF